eukprot:CAMPEP_0181137766 /NCGR_PEP_ID=MMETSP1071-20121207/33877_1 /TAXON_ID=35127 /ORGANISM="Thalassiosira sp., Strain NH16" /LENGTH=259 /DNA_ID=CAMNT_0023224535 /DNA_START=176 /DNA_END=953 /DNA_ORIENTATION=+
MNTQSNNPLIIRVAVGSTNPCKIEAVRVVFEDVFRKEIKDAASAMDGATIRDVNIIISSFDVPSGVSDQPFGDAETRLGAMNRAKAAYDAAAGRTNDKNENAIPILQSGWKADWKGNESSEEDRRNSHEDNGNTPCDDELWCMAWMAVMGSDSASCIAAKADGDGYSSSEGNKMDPISQSQLLSWGYAKTGSFLLPPALCKLVIEEGMELGHADDRVFERVNSKHSGGTVGILTDGMIDRADYYVHALKLALIPWIRPE